MFRRPTSFEVRGGKPLGQRNWDVFGGDLEIETVRCPWDVGDVLWVRENYHLPAQYDRAKAAVAGPDAPVYFPGGSAAPRPEGFGRARPGIHMPRSLCRARLEITEIRPQALHMITQADAAAEGAPEGAPPIEWFEMIWTAINGRTAWVCNPPVWALTFEVMS